jgi:hypothetical protein
VRMFLDGPRVMQNRVTRLLVHPVHGSLSVVSVVCCQVEVSATG